MEVCVKYFADLKTNKLFNLEIWGEKSLPKTTRNWGLRCEDFQNMCQIWITSRCSGNRTQKSSLSSFLPKIF